MKTNTIKNNRAMRFIYSVAVLLALYLVSCKDKKDPKVEEPPAAEEPVEVITTFKIQFTDSASATVTTFMFNDPDGEGGQPAFYGPDAATQTDSLISLGTGRTYYTKIFLLNETTNPVDTVSEEVKEEGSEHMLFFNPGSQTVLFSGNPYTVKINPVDIVITYTDLDGGTPQRGIGLDTRWRTPASGSASKHPLRISLKHQPGNKDGTSTPGETDIEVDFKLKVE